MDKDQWQKVKSLYLGASQLDASMQTAYVVEHTIEDIEIRKKVLAMLAVGESDTPNPADKIDDANLLGNTGKASISSSLTNIVSKNADDLMSVQQPSFIGKQVENFTIQKLIGEGGMGSVFLAKREHSDFEQNVAIKVIHKQKVSAQNIQRFRRERQILAVLKHKHIASFISGGETQEGIPYIILDYIEGLPITDYCQQNQLNIAQRLSLFKQVLEAIEYAHQNLVVHRDIKPSNVLVTDKGEVKLLDFGIAKLLQVDENDQNLAADLTHESLRLMTPSNASPEQILGEAITTRSDIYGLGTLLMHMLTDQPVFDVTQCSSRDAETMIIEQTPVKPSEKCAKSPDVSLQKRAAGLKGDLDTIVMHALHKSPERRYSTVQQLLEDIRRYQAKFPIMARPDSIVYRCKKFAQRNTLATVLSLSFLVSLISFSVFVNYQSGQIQMQRDIALEQSDIAVQTAEFMTDLFASARVDLSDGEQISAMDLLQQAQSEIQEFDTSQSVKSILLLSIAKVYTTLDEYDKALTLLAEARTLLNTHPFANPQIHASNDLKIDVELGDILMLQGELVAALEVFEKVLVNLNKYAAQGIFDKQEKVERYRAIEYSLSILHDTRGNYSLAAVHIQKAIDYAQQSDTEPVPSIFYITQGGILRNLGNHEGSRGALLRSVEQMREMQDTSSLEFAYALNQLAATMELLGESQAAIEYAKEGLAIRVNILGQTHGESIASAGMLSNLHSNLGNYKTAASIRERVLSAMEADNKTTHPFYAITLGSLSNIYKRDGLFEKAKPGLQSAFAMLNDMFEDGHPEVARPLLILSEIAILQQQFLTADNYVQQAQAILDKFITDDHQLSGMSLALQSVLFTAKNKPSEAQSTKQRALDMYSRLYGTDSQRYTNIAKLIATGESAVKSTNRVN